MLGRGNTSWLVGVAERDQACEAGRRSKIGWVSDSSNSPHQGQ